MSWLADRGLLDCGLAEDGPVKMRLITSPPAGPADKMDLAEVLERAFTAEELTGLHAAAAAYPAAVRGAGPWQARGAHTEAWTTLVTALAIAQERATHPPRTVISTSVGEHAFQVFLERTDTPMTVRVLPPDGGAPYESTIVPNGADFQLEVNSLQLPPNAGFPPALILVPVSPAGDTKPTEEETRDS